MNSRPLEKSRNGEFEKREGAASQPAKKVFSLGGRSFSSDVKGLLSTGFQPLKKAFSSFVAFFLKLFSRAAMDGL
jgi:hypothetical protein